MNYTSLSHRNPNIDAHDFKYTGYACYELAKELIHIGLLVGFFRVDTGIGLYLVMAGNNSRPQVMVAACGFIMMMYSSIAVITFATLGLIKLDYGFWFFSIGFIGGAIGYGGLLVYWRKTQRLSTAYLIVGGVVGALITLVVITHLVIFVREGVEGTFQYNFIDPCVV
jgi:hypothetical protein